ncbi:MAG: hypothetical protein OXN90_15725 [Gemmatimonadota bacterium]|nr:hypothetical protein [Gemmatimonadota bacterium]
MKKIIIIATVLGLVLASFTPSSAHQRTDRNWAAVQVPINVDGIRDVVMDGDLGDWDNVPSIFWVTQDDLVEVVTGTQGDPDPGNLAERIIVGWNPETNLVYVMEERFDDLWYGTIEGTNDKLELVLDANHSGGQFQGVESIDLDPERWAGAEAQDWQQSLHQEAQLWLWGGGVWASVEPYAGIRWNVEGEAGGPATLFQESWFTTFDDLPASSTGPDDPDLIIHDLEEGQVMGVGMAIQDDDNGPGNSYNGYWVSTGDINMYFHADSLVDYVLLGFDANNWVSDSDATAVEEDSWARIKAGFSK